MSEPTKVIFRLYKNTGGKTPTYTIKDEHNELDEFECGSLVEVSFIKKERKREITEGELREKLAIFYNSPCNEFVEAVFNGEQ